MDSGDAAVRGAAAESARQYKAQREADAAAARAIAPLARLNIRERGGIDAVRSALGTDAALEIAKLAGLDTDRLSAQWAASEPARRQVSVGGPGGDYGGDPRHDQRVIAAASVSMAEFNRVLAEVGPEYAQRAKDKAARHNSGLGPAGAQGGSFPDSGLLTVDGGDVLGVSYETMKAPDGRPVRRPVQRSLDYKSWEQLHAEDPAAAANGLAPGPQPVPAPVNGSAGHWAGSVTECNHDTGKPFCSACGKPLPVAAATTGGQP